jgi:hypothetical protein
MSEQIRPHLLKGNFTHITPPETQQDGRTGLYDKQCMSSYRPKFICPERQCRRSIKPIYDPERNEYDINEFQDWQVRPLESTSPEFAAARKNASRINSRTYTGTGKAVLAEIQEKKFKDPRSLTEKEREYLRENDPQEWWELLVRGRSWNGKPLEHQIRCPSCGKTAVRVGSKFEIAGKNGEKAWKEIEGLIAAGEDMVAKFSGCATIQEHQEMVEEVQRQEESRAEWELEKARRIRGAVIRGED